MSKSKEAREARRLALQHYKEHPPQPMRVVPSKRGLTTVFLFCALLGYVTGIVCHYFLQGAK